jgi:hypothetical protein
MLPWICKRCGEDQVAFWTIPEDLLCHTCLDAERARNAFTETHAGIPESWRNLTRASWETYFQRPWPEAVASWTGTPPWIALWGPTGIGKTSLATILLAEHIRAGRRGRWTSGPDLARRLGRDLANAEDVIAPLCGTSLLVLDEPLLGAAADWYIERIVLITYTRYDRGLPTIVTSQLLPELLDVQHPVASPPVLSRWLSGLHLPLAGDDIRLQKAL